MNEQDSLDDVAACVAALLLCPLGWRAERVEYGTNDQTFLLNLQLPEIAAAIARWEPRAVYLLQEGSDDADQLARQLTVLLEVPR